MTKQFKHALQIVYMMLAVPGSIIATFIFFIAQIVGLVFICLLFTPIGWIIIFFLGLMLMSR